jgi:hypothetical protein
VLEDGAAGKVQSLFAGVGGFGVVLEGDPDPGSVKVLLLFAGVGRFVEGDPAVQIAVADGFEEFADCC